MPSRLRRCRNRAAACWLAAGTMAGLAGLPAAAAPPAEGTLLSRNATYRIKGEGFVYNGQVQPGRNERPQTPRWMATPLVAQSDTGDLLIDGKTGRDSVVSTPWFWNKQAKRIHVEMDLPGSAKVSSVRVRLPEDSALRPESIRLSVRAEGGRWQEVAPPAEDSPDRARDAWTFQLPSVQCRSLRVVAADGVKARIGLAEIGVFGRGPTESDRRGLIRDEAHVKSVRPAEPSRPPGAVCVSRSPRARVRLSGTPITAGDAGLLVDGKQDTLVRIEAKPHLHLTLTAEIDLGAVHRIDCVNVWMPGGRGASNGHVHDFSVAVSPSADGAGDWQTPLPVLTNPYWPTDDAPSPYVIPLDLPGVNGRRVRVTATLSGTGGVTCRLALAEVEVWGRPAAPGSGTRPPPRLQLRPLMCPPEPVGDLHPKLRWMKQRKVRLAWIGDDLFDRFADTEQTKAEILVAAGFNLVRVSMNVDRKDRNRSSDLEKRLAPNVREARRAGIPLLIGWQYGSSHLDPYRRYRSPGGRLANRSCCPLDSDYIERHLARWAVAIAQGGADGMVVDTEMYESDQTNYPGPCVCDDCFAEYLRAFATEWETMYKAVLPERRGAWLSANGAAEHYGRFLARRIETQYDAIRTRCQQANPAFVFAHAPLLGHLAGIERGLGTATVPCLVLSEREYNRGPSLQSFENVARIRREGIPALYMTGLFVVQQPPEQVEKNALIGALYGDGWWLYYATAILNRPEADDPGAFHGSYGRVKGTSARDYLDRIEAMHRRLEGLLSSPRDAWPKPNAYPPPPSAEVPRRVGEVAIDGRLGEAAWTRSVRLDLTHSRWGEAVGPTTLIRLSWDEQALYVGAHCALPEGQTLSAPERGRDNSRMWQHDGIEVFLDPGKSGRRYGHFVLSGRGDVSDSLVNPEAATGVHGNTGWNAAVEVSATSSDGEFTIEARIPFQDLASPPEPGSQWGANFCRFRPSEITWSPTYAGFHTPARFGALRFVE